MKKWFLLGAAALLLGVILYFYVSFNGNFITKWVAKGKVEAYVEETYQEYNKQLVESSYSFKDGRYYFFYDVYVGEKPARYSFAMGGPFLLDGRIYNYLDLANTDEEQVAAFGRAGSQFLREQLDAKGIAYDQIDYYVEIPQGMFEGEVSWQPQVEAKLMPTIWFELTDRNQTEAEFLQQAEEIRAILTEQEVTFHEAWVSVTREFDNTDGAKEGYAPIYYETIYQLMFTPETEELKLN